MSLEVRRAVPDDLPRVRELLVDSMDRDHGYGYRPDWHADFDTLQASYLEAEGADLLVAVLDGRVVGSIALRPGAPSSCPDAVRRRYQHRAGCAQLVRLVVDPAVRRRGVARELVSRMVERAREMASVHTLCLHTNADNPTSVAFWRSTGAVEVLDERQLLPATADYHALHLEFDLA